MDRNTVRSTGALLFIAALASSCQTRQPVEPTTPDKVPAGAPVFFHPAVSKAAIMLDSGRYPILFDSTSQATWIEPQAATPPPASTPATASVEGMNKEDPKMMAETVSAPAEDAQVKMLAANFNVIVCDVASAFTDTSIAYDVVGFRNIDVYLMSPDGQQFRPVQRILGTKLDEESMGALKKYHRRNILLFAKEPVPVATPLAETPAPKMRLYFDGYGSKFYFEWPAQVPGDIGAPKLSEQEWVKKGESTYRGVHKKERAIIHKFD